MRWEYKTITVSFEQVEGEDGGAVDGDWMAAENKRLRDELRELGQEGWELVATDPGQKAPATLYIFKRAAN